jgi:hypothetical protein
VLADRTVLVDEKYFCVERIPVDVSRTDASLAHEGEPLHWLAYLFAAAGSGRIHSPGQGFEPVDLPPRGIVAIPAASPEFAIEDTGGLELIRITPNWPEEAASGEAQ